MKHYQKVILFLLVNFAALGLGSWLQGPGPSGDWYQNLNIAPWTPPGIVFGVTWTVNMICFSFFMADMTEHVAKNKLILLFTIQFILNVCWNPIFFKHHMIGLALVVIVSLTILIFYLLLTASSKIKNRVVFILPYAVWLCIACSLNVYALLNN